MKTVWQDLRYSFRLMFKAPGLTAVVICSMAICIGVNNVAFGVLNTVLLRRLPFPESDRLVRIFDTTLSYPNYVDYRDRATMFDGFAAYSTVRLNLGGSRSDRVVGEIVTSNFFDILGVRAILGRTFLPGEDRAPGAQLIVVLSYGLWRNNFNSDPQVIGQNISLNGQSFTIIGVAPERFAGASGFFRPALWVPMMADAQVKPGSRSLFQRDDGFLEFIGRLKTGVTLAQAESAIRNVTRQLKQEYPNAFFADEGRVAFAQGIITSPQSRRPIFLVFTLLMIAAGLVLLVACANIASLLLARAMVRRKEIAIRLTLGASRSRLIRQLLTESLVLSVFGGGIGLLFSSWVTGLLPTFIPPGLGPLAFDLSPDIRVLSFTVLLSLVSGIAPGMAPAFQITKSDIIHELKNEMTVTRLGRKWFSLRYLLVIIQVTVSVMLLIGAGLLIRSALNTQLTNPGFDADKVVAMSFDLGLNGYDKNRAKAFYEQLIGRVQSLPGIESSALAMYTPLSVAGMSSPLFVEGDYRKAGEKFTVHRNIITPRYFQTMGIPILQGRDFTDQDTQGQPEVVVINETLARSFWPGQSPVGKTIKIDSKGPSLEIVGVVKDIKYFRLEELPVYFIYHPLLQNYSLNLALHTRTAVSSSAAIEVVRSQVSAIDRNLSPYNVKTLAEQVSAATVPARLIATLAGFLSFTALLLATVGLYGLINYSVTQRTREFGIRIAIGAKSYDILKMVIREGTIIVFIGITLGALSALVLTRLLQKFLYGIHANDPVTFASTIFLLFVIAIAACVIPTSRALKIDPLTALREE